MSTEDLNQDRPFISCLSLSLFLFALRQLQKDQDINPNRRCEPTLVSNGSKQGLAQEDPVHYTLPAFRVDALGPAPQTVSTVDDDNDGVSI